MSDELNKNKPCPFCGSTENYYWLHPEKCYLRMRFTKPMDISEEQLLKARNTRPLEDALRLERDRAVARLADYLEGVRVVLADEGSPDEIHCGCVPVLRKRIIELTSERDAAVSMVERLIEAGDKMADELHSVRTRTI